MSYGEDNPFDYLLIKYFSPTQVKTFKKSNSYPRYVKIFKLITDKNNRKQADDFEKIFKMISYYSKIDVMFDIYVYFKIFQFRFFREIFFEECYFHVVVYCQKSWGFGDIMYGIKNKLIMDRFYPEENIFFVVRTEEDGKLINASLVKQGKAFRIFILEEYILECKKSERMAMCPKQIYVGAVGANQKRFDDIPGKKVVIFLDEYNGWRVGVPDVVVEDRLESVFRDLRRIEDRMIGKKCWIKSKYVINQSVVDKNIYVSVNTDEATRYVNIDYVNDMGNVERLIWSARGRKESFDCLAKDIDLDEVYCLTTSVDITRLMTEGINLGLDCGDFVKEILIMFLKKSANSNNFLFRDCRYVLNPIYDAYVIVKEVWKRSDVVRVRERGRVIGELKTKDECRVAMLGECEVCSCRSCVAAEHAGRLRVPIFTQSLPRKIDMRWLDNEQTLPLAGSAGIGLNKHKYPCSGIHLEINIPTELKDTKLMSYLAYLKETKGDNFYFAYNSDSAENNYSYLSKFIETICHSRCDQDRWINIMLISRDCYFPSDNTLEFQDIKLYEFQKVKLRIFINESIIHDDMIYMMAVSQDLIFVSGDQSFAEVIALCRKGIIKILFYQVQLWKMDLVREYRNVVHYIWGDEEPLLKKFIDLVFSKIPCTTTLVDLIKYKKVQLLEQSGILYNKIVEIFNFEDALISWVNSINMKLFFSTHPLAEIFFL
ncbi:MAG: putative ORFan [Harvfovirus sp.]|uniref:Putative ORFan n=1 Tax=Harvfovirus sp. TaxID=2487768 RepID=A0A3G5A2L7_9VIRU|nr:MAG: putative ORFan [Harvfovirus sp.]